MEKCKAFRLGEMRIIREISSAFAEIGRGVKGNAFFTATAITVFLWFVAFVACSTGMMIVAAVWTIAYLIECVCAISVAGRER